MDSFEVNRVVADETEMITLGGCLAAVCQKGIVTLEGDLGTGKTTLVRAWLHALGWHGRVKSPTFTLIEPYEWDQHKVYHLDLYRLSDASELEWLGVRDLFTEEHLCFVEWPQRASGLLPAADIAINIQYHGEGRQMRLNFRSTQLARSFAKNLSN